MVKFKFKYIIPSGLVGYSGLLYFGVENNGSMRVCCLYLQVKTIDVVDVVDVQITEYYYLNRTDKKIENRAPFAKQCSLPILMLDFTRDYYRCCDAIFPAPRYQKNG